VSASFLKSFQSYLSLERSLSENTVAAYLHDVALFFDFLSATALPLKEVRLSHLQSFLAQFAEGELSVNTQARVLSGIKSFFRFLLLERIISEDPTMLLEAPKQRRVLPDVLSLEEIDALLAAIDHSKPEGQRDRAIIETMYSCGLRVSELTGLTLSGVYADLGLVRVSGKGDKERIVPLGSVALKHIQLYLETVRCHKIPAAGCSDIVFLNHRGGRLSRIAIFQLVKKLTSLAGIHKNVHPHTLRHSFATHLVTNGADLRAVQEMLGHKSITTTEIYTHLDRAYLRSVLEQCHPRYHG
jgi:integrase/recombinase XerD